jgi:formylglycine-generating enzyme required for sulfatase activity
VRTRLAAGDYLVVAYFDDQRFHEVYRHVPELREGAPEPFRHRRWKEVAGRLELPTVRIPNAMFINEMALVPGRDDFVIGSPALPGIAPPHHRRVPSFLLDTTEVTIGMCKTKLPDWKPLGENMTILPPADFAVFGVSHDQALALAELLGKRLPDETEYEYAATSGGTRDFPWGTAATAPPWSIGPVGAVAEDRVDLDPSHPIFGLCSNVAEWTCSWHTLYPGHAERAAAQAKQRRVVRGGDSTVLDGTPDFDPVRCSPRNRLGVIRQTWKPGLGLRCARSVKPRLEPDDFIRPRSDLDAPQIVPTR